MKRILPLLVMASLVCTLFLVPVGAVDVTQDVQIVWFNGIENDTRNITVPRSGQMSSIARGDFVSEQADLQLYSARFIPDASGVAPSGVVGYYLSWFVVFNGSNPGSFSTVTDTATYYYVDGDAYSASGNAEVESYTPVFDKPHSQAFTLKANIQTEAEITDFIFYGNKVHWQGVDSKSYRFDLYIPSASVVATESSADLEALENIADQISQNNAIMQAMYGDIMSALNAILEKTGSLEAAQEVANAYILQVVQQLQQLNSTSSSIYTLLSTYLHYLQQIAETAQDIKTELAAFHSDFMTKLDLLISTVSQESDDIQAKMEEIYEQLQAWLDSQFEQAIDEDFEQGNADLEQGIQNNDQIEQQWTGSLSDAWAQTGIDDFEFDAGFTSAFMWVSGWFSTFFNAFGVYSQILLFPAILGLAMLLLGMFRSGRLGSRGSSGPRGTPVDVPNGEYHRYDPW